MNNKLISKAISLVSEANTAMLSSIDEKGYPRAVEMSNIKTESLNVMYFATGTRTRYLVLEITTCLNGKSGP